MNYDEALEFIYSRRKFQKSSGHERIARLLELMDNPHRKLRFVHVVGTNGKGSVSTALAQILQDAGYVTGLFTSPFVVKFGERIRINGDYIPECAVASITKMLREKILVMEKEELYPTVFEVITALAMVYFCDMNCDVVVLEAGIGGGKDSTSVIERPVLAVITSVSADHTDVLGDSIAEIAKEKCGIIKGGCSVVSYPFENGDLPFVAQNKEAADEIARQCKEKGSRLYIPDCSDVRLIRSDISGNEFDYGKLRLISGQSGSFQVGNILTAVKAAQVLSQESFLISNENIERGIADFFIPGRLECVSSSPTVVLDAAHNEGAMVELVRSLEGCKSKGAVRALCAFMKDKDYEKALSVLAPCCDKIVFTCADEKRGESPQLLAQISDAFCLSDWNSKPDDAFEKLLAESDKNDILLVCGSFYLVSEIRKKYFDD